MTNELIGRSGVIRKHTNRLLMYLIFTSRKTKNPLHCISLGSSRTGKTHLQSKVSELIPKEGKIEITALSANAFYNFIRIFTIPLTELQAKPITPATTMYRTSDMTRTGTSPTLSGTGTVM